MLLIWERSSRGYIFNISLTSSIISTNKSHLLPSLSKATARENLHQWTPDRRVQHLPSSCITHCVRKIEKVPNVALISAITERLSWSLLKNLSIYHHRPQSTQRSPRTIEFIKKGPPRPWGIKLKVTHRYGLLAG